MKPIVRHILDDLCGRLRAIYGTRLARVMLFGSQARNTADPHSDIDVLVVLKGVVSPSAEIKRTVNDVAELSLNHNVVISCIFISEKQYRHEKSPLLLNAKREGITV